MQSIYYYAVRVAKCETREIPHKINSQIDGFGVLCHAAPRVKVEIISKKSTMLPRVVRSGAGPSPDLLKLLSSFRNVSDL